MEFFYLYSLDFVLSDSSFAFNSFSFSFFYLQKFYLTELFFLLIVGWEETNLKALSLESSFKPKYYIFLSHPLIDWHKKIQAIGSALKGL